MLLQLICNRSRDLQIACKIVLQCQQTNCFANRKDKIKKKDKKKRLNFDKIFGFVRETQTLGPDPASLFDALKKLIIVHAEKATFSRQHLITGHT